MHETVTAITTVLGILAMLLALYNVKFDKKVAGKFLTAMVIFYGIATISAFTDSTGKELMADFKAGRSLMCKDDIVSKETGWKAKDNEYLIKNKKIYYIKMCKKI